MTSLELLICVALVLASAIMSSSEVALFSLSRFQLRSLREHVRPSIHRRIKRLLADPGGLLIAILVVNEIVNISLSSIITQAVSRLELGTIPLLSRLPDWTIEMVVSTAITAPIVLFACEITPKVIGARANQLVASLTAAPMNLLYDGLKPVRLALTRVVAAIARWSMRAAEGGHLTHGDGAHDILKESDFLFMVEEGHKEGAIHESELELIRNVFEMDDTPVDEILQPISQVYAVSAQTTLKSALAAFRTHKHSRIPVTGPNQRIVGILYSKDLLRVKLEPELMPMSVAAIMRRPIFVSPTLRLNALFRKLKQERTHLAVVQSSKGEPLGIVTMSDVMEALFEDLFEEKERGGP